MQELLHVDALEAEQAGHVEAALPRAAVQGGLGIVEGMARVVLCIRQWLHELPVLLLRELPRVRALQAAKRLPPVLVHGGFAVPSGRVFQGAVWGILRWCGHPSFPIRKIEGGHLPLVDLGGLEAGLRSLELQVAQRRRLDGRRLLELLHLHLLQHQGLGALQGVAPGVLGALQAGDLEGAQGPQAQRMHRRRPLAGFLRTARHAPRTLVLVVHELPLGLVSRHVQERGLHLHPAFSLPCREVNTVEVREGARKRH
mmetsp:Transcript_33447/g.80231  ORF Transcript_33447/g.80231 Transcript_33447/m.80231 type:complete len:256 (+) Transcript_33447:2295-3062(+)